MARRVVLIEDEVNIAEAIRFLLTRDGWEVTHVADGAAALAVLKRAPPEVVILDVMLPGASGFDVLAALRAEPALAQVPVLMLTARGQARDRAQAQEAGVSRFMTKPFANADLLAAVRELAAAPGAG